MLFLVKRFYRRGKKGLWLKLHLHFASDPDMESIMIDSTVVGAHVI